MPNTENVITSFDAAEYHKNQFHKLVSTFLLEADPGECVELQHNFLNVYLEGDEVFDNRTVIHTTTLTTSFLAQLKSKYENYVKFNNVERHG